MNSIRFYLVSATIACITLINFTSALHGYRSSMLAEQQLFDQELKGMATMLATARHKKAKQPMPVENDNFMAYQIWREDQVLLDRSENAPSTAIAPFEVGYRDLNFGEYRWRIFVHYDKLIKEWTFLAERSDIRSRLADKVILESILPTVLALPLVALLIWIIIGSGLKPLRKLANQLQCKEADDLTPIPAAASPVELKPLIESTNGLLHRLEASFLREKRFAADAAHELRTPISVLKVNLYNLQAEWPKQAAILQPFKQSIERMGHLVEQILALNRSTPNQYMSKFETIELLELARNTIISEYDQFNEKQQLIELLGEPCRLTGDQFALSTLLQNLLSNASKYSPQEGTIIVTVVENDAGVVLRVEDSGPGIDENEYLRVFERFYRINSDQHNSGVLGCGLGLAIVKHIADLHDASIILASSRFATGLSVTLMFPKTWPKQKAEPLSVSVLERSQ